MSHPRAVFLLRTTVSTTLISRDISPCVLFSKTRWFCSFSSLILKIIHSIATLVDQAFKKKYFKALI